MFNGLRAYRPILFTGVPLALALSSAFAQDEPGKPITVSDAAKAAVASATHSPIQPLGLNTPNAPRVDRGSLMAKGKPAKLSSLATGSLTTITQPGFYPGDLIYNGGAVVQSATSHSVFVNCQASCGINPNRFLTDLNESPMMHITDEYVGAYGNNRYPTGTASWKTLPHAKTLYDADMMALAYEAAAVHGTGYGHIYHIFLAPGQDVCLAPTAPLQCYSPDNQNTFYFCGYHSSFDAGIGHIIYTVEPNANVSGCQVQGPSPNGLLLDSAYDILSHELFESITDPDGDAWWNSFGLGVYGEEVGDECQASGLGSTGFTYGDVTLNGRKYEIQPEYSNSLHGCTYAPNGIN